MLALFLCYLLLEEETSIYFKKAQISMKVNTMTMELSTAIASTRGKQESDVDI